MKEKIYVRKDKTTVVKAGRWKLLEIFKRPGVVWCCYVFNNGKIVSGNGYHSSALPKKQNAITWGRNKAKELKLIP